MAKVADTADDGVSIAATLFNIGGVSQHHVKASDGASPIGDANPVASSAASRCGVGGGDCATNADCLPGLLCRQDTGWKYGFAQGTDACMPPHCFDRVQGVDELGPDWGGSCGAQRCFPSPNGGYQHCTVGCPCPRGEGDCDYDDECQTGLACTSKGATFGVAFNVCLEAHCKNNVKDADETGMDCGGLDCGPLCP